ncbi:MAG: ACT domain-containing protein [Chitinophagaceae bacterium]|nr:ACT domain-containing protein [Chitinophagaceae bacterium]
MNGETNISLLLKHMKPQLNASEYVFCQTRDASSINIAEIIGMFKEAEAFTVVLKKETADNLQLPYSYIAAWITLAVHSSLNAVGLTAAFSKALAEEGISCNVIAAYYHDHIFVDSSDAFRAMDTLKELAAKA